MKKRAKKVRVGYDIRISLEEREAHGYDHQSHIEQLLMDYPRMSRARAEEIYQAVIGSKTPGIYRLALEIHVPDLGDVGAMDAVDDAVYGALEQLRAGGDLRKAIVRYQGDAIRYVPHGKFPATKPDNWRDL